MLTFNLVACTVLNTLRVQFGSHYYHIQELLYYLHFISHIPDWLSQVSSVRNWQNRVETKARQTGESFFSSFLSLFFPFPMSHLFMYSFLFLILPFFSLLLLSRTSGTENITILDLQYYFMGCYIYISFLTSKAS